MLTLFCTVKLEQINKYVQCLTPYTIVTLTAVVVPSWLRDHHLRAPFVKFTPQTLRVQRDSRVVSQRLLRLHGLRPPLAALDVMAAERRPQPGVGGSLLRQRSGDIRERQRPEKRGRIGGVEAGWWVEGVGSMDAEGMVAMHGSLWSVIQLDAASLKEWNSCLAVQEKQVVYTCEEGLEVVSIQNLQLHWMKAREVRSDGVVASERLPS